MSIWHKKKRYERFFKDRKHQYARFNGRRF